MIPLENSPHLSLANTVMPSNMVGPGPLPNMSLNLDEKKAQKKAEDEKRKKKGYAYLLFSLCSVVLVLYSVYFFYPNLMAYIKAPAHLEQLKQQVVKKGEALKNLQEEKSLHQAAYKEENERKTAIVDLVFPEYSKLKIIRDIESAANALKILGTFEMNSITVDPPVPQPLGWVTFVSGSFKASKPAFEAFITDYVGNSGNLEDAKSTIVKEIKQLSIKPIDLNSVRGAAASQAVNEKGFNVSFKLAFYTRPEKSK